jgi:2-oxoisovalerate dehydrogenase E2 component (dihydrolipoyl transacylase)
MSQYVFKMPDLGEGTVEAEIVMWHTKPGDAVVEDQLIVEVMTDKAAVEVPAPVTGRVVSVTGGPGDKVAVGAPLIVFEMEAAAGHAGGVAAAAGALPKATPVAAAARAPAAAAAHAPAAAAAHAPAAARTAVAAAAHVPAAAATPAPSPADNVRGGRVIASPATRRIAREAGVDLSTVAGSGPGGRILRDDIAAAGSVAAVPATAPRATQDSGAPTTEIKVIGVRRLIADRMSEAKRNIPHFAYVEEVDVTELESLRQHLNGKLAANEPALTYLPFVILGLVRTLELFPQCNVLYDATRGVLIRHRAVHVGIATQTADGLKVPVVRNAEARPLWDLAAELRRVSQRAKSNQATRDELTGSTITVTSLGKLGGIASTPIINAPEVAIIGLNKAVERPVVQRGAVAIRRIMNVSSSFDHRFVDGYDAAAMIQALKERLEHPATIFFEG